MHSEVIFFSAKLIGALLTIAGCAGIGIYKSREITGRIFELKEMKRLLLMLRGEIRYTATPIPEAMAKIAGRCRGQFQAFFSSVEAELYEKSGEALGVIWGENIERHFGKSNFCEKDIELLKEIGENLGYLDKQMQLSTMDLYIENMNVQIKALENAAPSRKRVYQCLGAFAGILAVILLI